MNPTQVNSFIEAANALKAGNYLEETAQGFQTTTNAAKGLSLQRIREIAADCLSALQKENDAKKMDALMTGLKNLESSFKATPFDKLPHVLMSKILEFESLKDLTQIDQVAHLFKAGTTRAKVWVKEAQKLKLDVPPEKAKEAVLEYYYFLPLVIDEFSRKLDRILSENERKDLNAISDPVVRNQAIVKLLKDHHVPLFFDDDVSNLDEKGQLIYMYKILWYIRTGVWNEEQLKEKFGLFQFIKPPQVRKRILDEAIKHLPPLDEREEKDLRLLRHYMPLPKEYFHIDIAVDLVNKFEHIHSKEDCSFIAKTYFSCKDQPEPCKALIRTLIQKGDRLLKEDEAWDIPEDMRKFIAEEVAKADAAKK